MKHPLEPNDWDWQVGDMVVTLSSSVNHFLKALYSLKSLRKLQIDGMFFRTRNFSTLQSNLTNVCLIVLC